MQINSISKALPFDPLSFQILTVQPLQLRQVLGQTMHETSTKALQNHQALPHPREATVPIQPRGGRGSDRLRGADGTER